MYLLGSDIGTQGTKTVLVDEKGNVIAEASREYQVITPRPNWAEQWPDTWAKAVFETVKEVVEKSNVPKNQIAGLAISGLYGGSGVPVDKDMNPLRPCLIWMDRRAVEETEWVKKNIPKDMIFGITGNYVDSYFGFTKIMWIRNNEPEIWKKIYKFISPKDYVIYLLTGEIVTDYSSAGNLGGVFDLKKLTWSDEMCKALGIPKEYLPERIVKSSDVVGKVKKEAAQLCGLLEGTPIVAGGIDAPVAQLSAGALEEGEHVAMVGTSTCWGTVHKGEKLPFGLVSYPYVVYDTERIYTFGGSATTGALARWFKEQFGETETVVGERTGISPYQLFDKEVANIPAGSEGIVVLPYFMGERSPIWDPFAKGVIFGVTLYHKRAHIYRALMEGAAYALRHNMEEGMKAGLKLSDECWIVGGVSKSNVWVKIFADVTGFKMRQVASLVEAPFGDAFLAGLGVGVIDRPERIKEWVRYKEVVEPDPQNKQIYDKYYEIFKELYESVKHLMPKL
ncbi:FGGY-family carbohydrate kinase [Pseudothermotoga thermarum]|uniref:Xylulokinase n=1 Tax=Pseudothermotoga thermarum DSM 5069 TaxID=688269 RepID=F7YTH8_9THEM|nr:FGGY-family carbohydrate kinase [Pseudothermotoga thermarum]AEH51192.1 Xylulokinase [Pseudothermotoga thermarum DSM 5069]